MKRVIALLFVCACAAGAGGGDEAATPPDTAIGSDAVDSLGLPEADSAPGDVGESSVAADQPAPSPSSTDYSGRVIVSSLGGRDATTLQTADGMRFVAGPLESELRALSNAEVIVRSARGAGTVGDPLIVDGYTVVRIEGETPYIGTLRADGGITLESGESLTLAGFPAALNAEAGHKVWIIGTVDGNRLDVGSAGVIRR